MTIQSKTFAMKQSTIWIVIAGFLFVLGWRALVMAAQYFREPMIVRELCSIPQFEQDLIPNSANTRLVFCQDTTEGVGIYFCDTEGGKPRFSCEQKEKGLRGRRFGMSIRAISLSIAAMHVGPALGIIQTPLGCSWEWAWRSPQAARCHVSCVGFQARPKLEVGS